MRNEPEYIELASFDESQVEGSRGSPNVTIKRLDEKQIRLMLLRLGILDSLEEAVGESLERVINENAEFMIEKVEEMKVSTALAALRDALAQHKNDVNFPKEDYHLIERLVTATPRDVEDWEKTLKVKNENSESEPEPESKLEGGVFPNQKMTGNKAYLNLIDWRLQIRLEAALIMYHSPYPEVRAITDPFDDPSEPIETLRVYVISLTWTFVGSLINSFFVHRLPAILLGSNTIQLLLLPSGKLWERVFERNKVIRVFGRNVNLNPGPWSYKEMMLSTIIYLCSSGIPYLIFNIFVMKLDRFYGLKWVTWPFQVFLLLSTQCLGFGFAGIMRKVCVYPAKALWPTILPVVALNKALMRNDLYEPPINGWKISRYSFFCLVFLASFFYNWIPSFFFKALSIFNWPTWINPKLIHLANITGSKSGLGLNPFPTLDWNILNAGNCLATPFYTYANMFLGSGLAFLVILTLYYTNNHWTAYLPINSNHLFNNKAESYNIHEILDDKSAFDHEKYQEYGPPYFGAANLVLYGAYFCLYPFAFLYHLVTEWESMKTSFVNVWHTITDSFKLQQNTFGRYKDDPHCRMMSKYEEVPDWWFMIVLLLSTVFAVLCVVLYPTETPVWGIFMTIIINMIFLVPLTAIASVTGFSFGLNVLVELLVGYTIPNSGLALITLKSFGYNIDSQASNYISDQKLAHYAKIPPKAIFKGQLLLTLVNVFVSMAVANWQIDNIENLCDPYNKAKFSCPSANTYFFSSVQYGEIGPRKVFSGLYPVLKWCFPLGVLLVVPCSLFKFYGPKKLSSFLQPTLIMGGFLLYAPYNMLYFTGGLYLSYIFMHRIKRDYVQWWEKYNYVLTSALSAGVAFSALIIFMLIDYHSITLDWWGNEVNDQGIEAGLYRKAWLDTKNAPDGYIGLRKGQY